MQLVKTENKNGVINSLELLEQINFFRKQEGNRAELQHRDLLKIIRDEFEEEIDEGKISPIFYKDSMNREQPMFELTLSQSKQVLVRESKFVRKAVIKKLEELEQNTVPKVPTSFREALLLAAELKEMYTQDDYLETKRILERHKQIAFADIKDFTEFKVEKTLVCHDEETGEPIIDKIFKFRIKDDFEVDGTLIKKIGMGKFGPVIELEDRAKSLELLNKVYGLDPSFEVQKQKLNPDDEKTEEKTITAVRKKYGL